MLFVHIFAYNAFKCIDHASKYGVKYVTQPGGSRMDDVVTAACDEYGIYMAITGKRLFLH